MEFRIEKTGRRITPYIDQKDFTIAQAFAKRIYKEFGTFISAIVYLVLLLRERKKGMMLIY